MQVYACTVIRLDAIRLQPLRKVVFPPIEIIQTAGSVERYLYRRISILGNAAVQAPAAPSVVRLSGGRGDRKEDGRFRSPALDHEQHIVGRIVRGQSSDIDAAFPIVRNL